MPLTKNLYNPSTPQSYNAHNTVVNKVIDGVNNHSHDPNQGTDTVSSGSFIPQFGSGDTRYTSVGPGSSVWSTLGSLSNKAAIPADPGETAIDPITGSVMTGGTSSSYSAITYGHGIGAELARIRGQLAKLTGQKWYTNTGAAVAFSAGGSGRDLSLGALTATGISVTPASNATPPFSITFTGAGAPPMVTNLNSQYIGGYQATTAPGTANTLLVTNAQGLLGQTAIAADTSETAVYNGSLTTANTIQDNLKNIRYVLQQWAVAAFGASGHWNTAATTTPTFVSGLNASGTTLSGIITLHSGVGVNITQDGPSSFRFDSTGVSSISNTPTLTYPDFFVDTVVYGSLSISNTNLTINVNSGMTGYVNGIRIQAGSSGYSYGPYTVVANATNYVRWNGGSQNSSYQVTQSNTSPGAGWILAATVTLTSGATNASQTTPTGGWTVITKTPILNTKPTITGSRSSGAALTSLLSQLNVMGLITDQTTP